jgi:hypothetical protein
MYESNRESLKSKDRFVANQNQEKNPLGQKQSKYSELEDIFPALQKYREEHSKSNLQKLCVEILEFCRSVYASTQSEEEREVYRAMTEKLNK